MAESKTKRTDVDVEAFLDAVADQRRREDAQSLCALLAEVTGEAPAMWGPSMVGFGTYHYRYESGREGDTFLIGFAPRKAQLVLYLLDGFEARAELLEQLGPHSTGKSCLYIKRLDALDPGVLRELVTRSVAAARACGS